jgi:hypothetical protein
MVDACDYETVKPGIEEIWEFRNGSRSSTMDRVMPHSMHVRGLRDRIHSRSVSTAFTGKHESVCKGFVETG